MTHEGTAESVLTSRRPIRPSTTVRRLMVAVAVTGVALVVWIIGGRWSVRRQRALQYASCHVLLIRVGRIPHLA